MALRKLISSKPLWIFVVTGLLVGATNGLVHGASSSTVINACKDKGGGLVRIVESSAQCRSSETPISWNQQGLQGPAGPQGIQGETGPQGLQGEQGPPGQGTDSRAHVATASAITQFPSGSGTAIALTIPHGSYTIAARTRIFWHHGNAQTVRCSLVGPVLPDASIDFMEDSAMVGDSEGFISMIGAFTTRNDGSDTTAIRMSCNGAQPASPDLPPSFALTNVRIVASSVGGLG